MKYTHCPVKGLINQGSIANLSIASLLYLNKCIIIELIHSAYTYPYALASEPLRTLIIERFDVAIVPSETTAVVVNPNR